MAAVHNVCITEAPEEVENNMPIVQGTLAVNLHDLATRAEEIATTIRKRIETEIIETI